MANAPDQPVMRPLFAQIEERIVERLTAGEWKPGTPLPSEFEFAQYYNVSQGTVRKAIARIADNQLVVRFRGKGTFVASHTTERERSRFFHVHRDDGTKELPESLPVSCRRRLADHAIASRLEIEAGAEVSVIERLRVIGGAPRAFETIVVADHLFPGLRVRIGRALPNELYPFYETRFGIRVVRAEERLKAVAAGPSEAAALSVEIGAPLLEIDRIAMTYGDHPVEWRRTRCDTAVHFYRSELR